jgi:DNA-binding response OmpR family regulator
MPGMDGLQQVKQRFPDLPVMMITADDERRRRAADYGAAEFITKPVDFDFLKEQLRQLRARCCGTSSPQIDNARPIPIPFSSAVVQPTRTTDEEP